METTVELRGPFSYPLWPVIVLGIILGVIVTYFFVLLLLRLSKKASEKPKKVNKTTYKNVSFIKNKYMSEINKIESLLIANKIDIRTAYINLSEIIRGFVYEMTDIDVRCYTLQDIRCANMPLLDQLITEYYYPEFAELSVADAQASIFRTRRVIEIWN